MALIDEAFPGFAEVLSSRLAAGVHTTEDSVRYLFFASLLELVPDPNRFVMEYPHPAISRAAIDTVVLDDTGRPGIAIEFKFDRAGPAGRTQPRPQKAGAALADLRRLAAAGMPESWFVHVLDREMHGYLTSPRNGLGHVWAAAPGSTASIDDEALAPLSATLRNRAGDWSESVQIEVVMSQPLAAGHVLVALNVF